CGSPIVQGSCQLVTDAAGPDEASYLGGFECLHVDVVIPKGVGIGWIRSGRVEGALLDDGLLQGGLLHADHHFHVVQPLPRPPLLRPAGATPDHRLQSPARPAPGGSIPEPSTSPSARRTCRPARTPRGRRPRPAIAGRCAPPGTSPGRRR